MFSVNAFICFVKTMQICSGDTADKIAGSGIRLTESGERGGEY